MVAQTKLTTSEEDPRAFLIENATSTKGKFWRIHGSFFVVTGMFLCLMVAVQFYPFGEWTWLLVLGLWLLSVWPLHFGRSYQMLGDSFVNLWKLVWQRGDRWSNPVAEDLHKLEYPERYTEKEVERAQRRKKFPRRYARYPTDIKLHRLGDIALWFNPETNSDSIIVVGDGSPLAALSYAEQHQTLRAYEQVVQEVSLGQNEFSVRCTFLFRRRPINRYKVVRMWLENHNPRALALADATEEQREQMSDIDARLSLAGANLKLRLELSDKYDADVEMVTVWTINRSHKLSHGSIGEDDLNREPIAELMADVLEGLTRCGVVNPRVLGLAELRRYIHAGLNVTNSDAFHAWADMFPQALHEFSDETRQRLAAEGLLGDALEEQVAVQTAPYWPSLHVKEGFSYCVIDGTWHTVLRMRSDEKFTLPDATWTLDAVAPRWYSRATLGETTTGSGELTLLNRTMPVMNEARKEIGMAEDSPQARARRQAEEDRRDALFQNKYKTDYSVLVCVSGTTHRELRDNVRRAKRLAKSLRMSPRVVHGRNRQLKMVLTATLGVPML